ncbi:hypothetical protein ACHQM5_020855 [Ranunculus cassubicifolius]
MESSKKKKKKKAENQINSFNTESSSFSSLSLSTSTTTTDVASTSTTSSSSCFDSTSNSDDPSSSSTSSDLFWEPDLGNIPVRGNKEYKQKRVVAATGTVANVIGKGYVRQSNVGGSKNGGIMKLKGGFSNTAASKEEAEQFCHSMLGEECELTLDVVRDVLCQYEYDVETALDVLLDLSTSSCNQSNDGRVDYYSQRCQDSRDSIECGGEDGIAKFKFAERMSDSIFSLSEEEVQQILHSSAYNCRSYSEVLTAPKKQAIPEATQLSLPQQILDSLFKIPKSSALEPDDMNWKNVVKKMEPFGQGSEFDAHSVSNLRKNSEHAKGEDYKVFRKPANQHYDAMKSCYLKASTAYTSGQKSYAAYLSDQGKVHNKVAREADEKASQDIFVSRNKAIRNTVTIDLHGQHVKQAIKLLKVHLLLFTTYVPSVQILRVITGCGSHGVGKSKLKNSVIDLIQRAGIQWTEENRGTVLMKLDGHINVSFAESEGDLED